MKDNLSTPAVILSRGVTPIEIFERAHARATAFISGGVGNKGRRDADDLRAAVVFAVASIDAFFRAKIIQVLTTKRSSGEKFILPDFAGKVMEKTIAKKLFRKEYIQLSKAEEDAVNAMRDSGKPYLIGYLQSALTEMSFQSVGQLDDGMRIMGEKPQEIWQRAIFTTDNVSGQKKFVGRPKKKKRGKKIDVKIQIENLFSRRHKIVHEADVNIQSRKHRGQERKISYDTVKRWIDVTEKIIKKIDTVISKN